MPTATVQPQPNKHTQEHTTAHRHVPRVIRHKEHVQQTEGFNAWVAVHMTRLFGSMYTFWFILAWILGWIGTSFILKHFFDPLPWPLLLCLASVPQLPLMIVIMVGQGLLGKHQEMQSEETYRSTLQTYRDVEDIKTQLAQQDVKLDELLDWLKMRSTMTITTGTVMDRSLPEKPPVKKNEGKSV
jgi:uncharacterized membrane protein